jgi:hypothetical protein
VTDQGTAAREMSVDRLPSPSTLRDAVDYLAGTRKAEDQTPSIPPDAGQNRQSLPGGSDGR